MRKENNSRADSSNRPTAIKIFNRLYAGSKISVFKKSKVKNTIKFFFFTFSTFSFRPNKINISEFFVVSSTNPNVPFMQVFPVVVVRSGS